MMNMNLDKILDQSESMLMCEEEEEAGDRFRTITKSKKIGFSIGGLVSGKRRALRPSAPKQRMRESYNDPFEYTKSDKMIISENSRYYSAPGESMEESSRMPY